MMPVSGSSFPIYHPKHRTPRKEISRAVVSMLPVSQWTVQPGYSGRLSRDKDQLDRVSKVGKHGSFSRSHNFQFNGFPAYELPRVPWKRIRQFP